jgi:hypothetical protein
MEIFGVCLLADKCAKNKKIRFLSINRQQFFVLYNITINITFPMIYSKEKSLYFKIHL